MCLESAAQTHRPMTTYCDQVFLHRSHLGGIHRERLSWFAPQLQLVVPVITWFLGYRPEAIPGA